METNDRELIKFTSLVHGLFHTYELTIPLFVGIWITRFELSPGIIGLIVTVGYALIGIGALPSGLLADRLGSRQLILVSAMGMGLGFVLIGFANGPIALTLALILWGTFASIYHPAGLSLISRVAEQRGTVFAYHGAGGSIGTALGPLSAVVLLSFLNWRIVALLMAIPALIAIFIGLRIEFDSTKNDGNSGSVSQVIIRAGFDSRRLIRLGFLLAVVAIFFYGIYYRGFLTFLPEILRDIPSLSTVEAFGWKIEPAQYLYTTILTIGIAGQYTGGRLTDRVGGSTAFLGAMAILAILAVLFVPAVVSGLIPLLLVSFALGFAVYATGPIYQVVVAEQAPDDIHGLSYGYTYLATFGIGAVGASMAGIALDYADVGFLFSLLAGIATLGMLFVLVLRQHVNR